MIKRQDKRKNGICLCVIGAALLLLLWRCFYSFSWSDESFYLTVVHRLWIGEKMFADEWYTTQLSAPILLPFYAAFRSVTGSGSGVYLFFRLLYLTISAITAVSVYHVIKKYHTMSAALFCALVYLFYSRGNIGGMSYYNLTLTFVLCAVILIYDQVCSGKASRSKLVVSGIFLALAVTQTPYICVPYAIAAIALLLQRRWKPLRKNVLWNGLGAALTAAVYLAYFLKTVPLSEIAENIPHILNEPELQSTNALFVLPLLIVRIAWRFRLTFLLSLSILAYIGWKMIRKQALDELLRKRLLGINAAVFLVNMLCSYDLLGCINAALFMFGLPYILLRARWVKEDRNVLFCFGTGGLGLSLAFSFSSDTGLDAMLIGFVLLAMGTALLMLRASHSSKIVVAALALTVLQTAVLRVGSVYRDAPLVKLDTQITEGPAKYIYTTKEHAEQYDTLFAAIGQYVRDEDIVLYSKQCFWSYLCTDNGYGTPSSWRMPLDSPRLEEYFTLYPQKIPTCVFVLNPEYGKFESSMIQGNEKDDLPNENECAGYLYEYMMKHDYEMIKENCATIYRTKE